MFDRGFSLVVLPLVALMLVSGCHSDRGEDPQRNDVGDPVSNRVGEVGEATAEVSASTPTSEQSPEPNASPAPEASATAPVSAKLERPLAVADGWKRYSHSEHGYSLSFPESWAARRLEGNILLVTNSDPDEPRGSGDILPPETIDMVIFPDVEQPIVSGKPVTVGVSGHDGHKYGADPWEYLNWDHELRIYYSTGSTSWMIDARFAEPADGRNPLVETFYRVIDTLEHQPQSVPRTSPMPPPYYDQEWAYRQRVIQDADRLARSFQRLDGLLLDSSPDDSELDDELLEILTVWIHVYDEFREVMPPSGYGHFHAQYLQALGWNAGSAYAVHHWSESDRDSFDSMVAEVMLRTADDLLNGAFHHWPQY